MLKQLFSADQGILAILCRHGATEANDSSEPLVRGWADFVLDDKGKLEAQFLGYKLQQYGIQKIFHSDFIRDSQTANIIANIVKTNDLEADFDLRTWDVGSYSDRPLKEVNPAIESLYKQPWIVPPGSSESFNDFSRRFINCLQNKLKLATIQSFRPILIVTHGKNIALANTWINGGNEWESIMPKPAGMAIISVTPERTLSMEVVPPFENVIEDI